MPISPLQNPGQTSAGMPDLTKFGIPSMNSFMPGQDKGSEKPSRGSTVRDIYRDLVSKGMHPKEAAKTAQAQTGHSVVTGAAIQHKTRFSKKSGKVIGQYGTSSGKASSGKFGQYGMKG